MTATSSPAILIPNSGPLETPGKSPEQYISAEGAKAFRTSVWNWIPSSSDTLAASEHGAADLPNHIPSRPDGAFELSPPILAKKLASVDRQRILSVMLAHCDPSNVARIATSFPSHKILEKLVHAALHFQAIGSHFPWLHIPTFSPSTVRNELLCALVACGAFLSPVSAVQALGSAIPDILLNAVNVQWGLNNANSRDLELCQTYALIVHIFMWSGSKRKMEIGESVSQPLVTILRRSGMLHRDYYRTITPLPHDSATDLESKWHSWVEQESRIRLVHHVFVHDAQVSMAQFVNPLLSCGELTLPTPASNELWTATTADEWRSFWLGSYGSCNEIIPPPSLADSVGSSLNALHPFHSGPSCGATTADSAVRTTLQLYGLWAMVWDCQVTSSWLRMDKFRSNSRPLLLSSRLDLVSQILDSFRPIASSASATTSPSQVTQLVSAESFEHIEKQLIFHYLSLALHAPLKRFAAFAGKEGETEARRVYHMLQEWTQSRESRQALWHAAQIYRSARSLPSSQLQNFFAVALYHASLTLWVFAIIVGAPQLQAQHNLGLAGTTLTQAPGKRFRLDQDLSPEVERFVALSDGAPTIFDNVTGSLGEQTDGGVAILYNPGAMMEAGIRLLKGAYPQHSTYDLPHFTEVSMQLMLDLAKAAQAVGYG